MNPPPPTDHAPTGHARPDPMIEMRVLDAPAEFRQLTMVLSQVWGTVTPIVGIEFLRAVSHTGGYVAGAYSGDRMVGGSLGFLGRHHGDIALHSHITGILPGVRQTGLGRAMKLHQRAWAVEAGLNWVTWTFDPLVRRNAWFNLGVLGATIDSYLIDFYGPMNDSINRNDPSDRLLVAWETAPALLDEPREPSATTARAGLIDVPTPEDIVALRRTDSAAAGAWRLRLREELGERLEAGATVVGFSRDGRYLLRPLTP